MKKLLLICSILFLGSQLLFAQTTLTAGDIAFVGYNSDGSDDFAFVLLTDIDSGTVIKFTDNGWFDNTVGFTSASGDSIITWAANSALIAGTVVHIEGVVASQGVITSGAGLNLNSFGDQILAYQGMDNVSATFISAIHMNIANGTDDTNWDNTTSANFDDESNLPNGLTNGVNAFRGYNIAVGNQEVDNIIYNCISNNTNTIDISALRASLNDILNWDADNFNPFTSNPYPCTFESDTCSNITNFKVTSSLDGMNANFTWDIVTEATSGYLVEVYNAGEDPTITTPLFIENVAAGTTTSTATGLTQYNLYDAYITADCGGVNGVSETTSITFESSACPRVQDVFLNNVGETTAAVGWDAIVEVTAGYIVEIYLAGANPNVDTPIATGTGAPQAGGLFFENLTPGTFYDAYVTSDCGANGLAATQSFTFTTLTSCPIISNLTGSNVTDSSIDVSWDNIPEATNGYILEVYNTGEDPNTTTALITEVLPEGTTNFAVTGLMAVTYYDIYVGSSCDASIGDSIPEGITFRTDNAPFICGNNFYDPGGPFENYPEVFSGSVTISPDVADDVVTVLFTQVDIDATSSGSPQITGGCLDYLRIYNGPDTSSPVLAMFLCGEESGSGELPSNPLSVLSIGDSFTSTHPSGALTFEFVVPIGGLPLSGWEADITCAPSLLSVDEFDLTSFSFSPNPTNGKVDFKSKKNIDSIEVFDVLGKKVFEDNPNSQEFTIDLINFNSGMYIVKVKKGNTVTTQKLIKN